MATLPVSMRVKANRSQENDGFPRTSLQSACSCSAKTSESSKLVKTATLLVPGASLHYQVRGQGPLLLLMSGGGGDADALSALAQSLEADYTIASYDRRGYARSPLDDPGDTSIIPVETAGDDAHHVLAALTSEPAYVFGSSLGALIGLELLTRHPEQVRLLVAHEPPTHTLVPESERPPLPDPNDPASAAKYAAAIGVKLVAPTNLPPEVERRRTLNGKHFISREARSARVYAPDLARLATVTSRLVLAGGEEGRPFIAYRCAAKAAERLGVPLVEFPGDHAAPSVASPQFVEKLRAVLARA